MIKNKQIAETPRYRISWIQEEQDIEIAGPRNIRIRKEQNE